MQFYPFERLSKCKEYQRKVQEAKGEGKARNKKATLGKCSHLTHFVLFSIFFLEFGWILLLDSMDVCYSCSF